MTVQFDQWFFSNPIPAVAWTPVRCSSLYAVMVAGGAPVTPPFTVIYFGETESLQDPDFFRLHPKYRDWVREADSEFDLYVSTYLCAGMTSQYREFVTSMLIREYEPAHNGVACL
jgi:hypothetical protein